MNPNSMFVVTGYLSISSRDKGFGTHEEALDLAVNDSQTILRGALLVMDYAPLTPVLLAVVSDGDVVWEKYANELLYVDFLKKEVPSWKATVEDLDEEGAIEHLKEEANCYWGAWPPDAHPNYDIAMSAWDKLDWAYIVKELRRELSE